MKKTTIQQFRKDLLCVKGDKEKMIDMCDNFMGDIVYDDSEQGHWGECCSGCGKPFEPGDRFFHYRGTTGSMCDTCFCDCFEAEIYMRRGVSITDDEGGEEIYAGVHGDDEEQIIAIY